MIQTASNFFSSIWDVLSTVLSFFKSIIDGITNILKMAPQVINLTTSGFGYLPSTLATFAVLTLTITIIYLIVGRNTGGSE